MITQIPRGASELDLKLKDVIGVRAEKSKWDLLIFQADHPFCPHFHLYELSMIQIRS